jgi:Putative prokaryotic signal transducing protein
VCGRPLCEKCEDRRGGVSRCADHAAIPMVEGWAEVYETGDEIEAQLIEENLRGQDIDARVFSQKDHAFNLSLGDMARVRVLVPAHDYLDALDIIRSHTPSDE